MKAFSFVYLLLIAGSIGGWLVDILVKWIASNELLFFTSLALLRLGLYLFFSLKKK